MATRKLTKIIIGQEVVCPDGLGRVMAFSDEMPNRWIQITTYINDRQCKWDFHNVKVVNLIGQILEIKENL